jgi:hypothetical protein
VRRLALIVAVAVLGAGCTEDSPPAPRARGKPVCDRVPGRGVEGFVLYRTERIDQQDEMAVRKEYRDPDGRLLVYLLGVLGEVGEGSTFQEDVELVDGTAASFLGGRGNWALVWEGDPPCPQMAVVGNGFRSADFAGLLVEADLLAPETVPMIHEGATVTEWVAALRTAEDLGELDGDTDSLMEVAPVNIIVGPVSCHQGLPEALGVPTGTFFSGLVAERRPELDRAITRAVAHPDLPDEPLVVDRFPVICLAD